MSILFAATHPERATALVLHGAMGRTTEASDYPWAAPAEALRESAAEFLAPYWGQPHEGMVELFAPSFAANPEALPRFTVEGPAPYHEKRHTSSRAAPFTFVF